ncbi:hypothetical protein F5Y00DRAFT_87929 [Daldinia vernicosa]|uniref:uncharacterized protein n=1 Tax=Daldinia vernicosa TaxID=114800 RepID=UPI002008504D|nr:uncharacterized protein F5Y00DRAFT_87929 [Daldinia vernicosa]KAI0848531.1 hypothetical protein F5Y00DRAFT_87929 [Daldinia vernicosa]
MPNSGFSGYATFSDFIATDPELSIYRTFIALNSRNLLYQQSELIALERKFEEFDECDNKESNLDILLSAKCWETFAARTAANKPHEAERMEAIKDMQTKLKVYHEALLLHSQILKLSTPGHRAFGAFRGWFDNERPFVGYGSDLLTNQNDFAALQVSTDQDFLSSTLQDLGGRIFPGTRHETAPEIKYYSAKNVSRLVTTSTVFLASLVINGAIVALYVVKDEHVRLGMITLFTSLFATSLAVLTDGRRTDIVLATAACAAVLVVFVSTSESG